jgi:hypothetical protein
MPVQPSKGIVSHGVYSRRPTRRLLVPDLDGDLLPPASKVALNGHFIA